MLFALAVVQYSVGGACFCVFGMHVLYLHHHKDQHFQLSSPLLQGSEFLAGHALPNKNEMAYYLGNAHRGYLLTEAGQHCLAEGGIAGVYLNSNGYVVIPSKRATLYSERAPTKEKAYPEVCVCMCVWCVCVCVCARVCVCLSSVQK